MKPRFKNLQYFVKYRNYLKKFKTIQEGPEICDLYWRMINHSKGLFYDVKTGDYWKLSVQVKSPH